MAIIVPRYDQQTVGNAAVSTPQAQALGADAFGAGIATGLNGLANNLGNIADSMNKEKMQQEKEDAAIKKEQTAETEKKKKQLETNQVLNQYMNFDEALFNQEQKIINDPNIEPADYLNQIQEFSRKFMEDAGSKTSPELWLSFQPKFREKSIQSTQRLFSSAQKEIDDQSWSEELAGIDGLVNNPTKTAEEKIMILKSPDLFASSGRPQHVIEAERQKRIAYVADTEVTSLFNAAGNDLTKLKQVKKILTGTFDDGTFSFLPEMPQKDREDQRSALQQKIKQAEHLQEMEVKQRETVNRQAAQELVTEYREKVNSGWMPNTKEEYAFVKRVKQSATYSPSLARQYNDAHVKMTSFASREQFRAADPLGTAAAEKGVILPPLNVTAPMGSQLESRAKVATSLGVKSLLKGDEIEALAGSLNRLDAVEQVKSIKTLSGQFGSWSRQTFAAAAEQIKTKDAGLSTLFKLASNGDIHAVKLYASGRQFLASEKKDLLQQKVTTLKTDLDEKLDDLLGTALRALPQSRNAVKDATAVAYIGAATAQGIPLDTVDPVLFSDIKKRIIGDTVSTGSYFGSNKTTIIPRGMTSDQFLNNIKAITPEAVASAGGVEGMDDKEAAKFVKGVAWHELGDGYGFYRDGKLLMGKDGKPFIWRQ
jgi:hypothetical protein